MESAFKLKAYPSSIYHEQYILNNYKYESKSGMEEHACNPYTQKAKAGRA